MPWVKLAAVAEVAPGTAQAVEHAGKRFAICNTGDGFYVIDDLCSHDNGPLDQGTLVGNEIECPRHGARFDVRTGRALCLPAVRPIKSYPTRVEGDSIDVDLPA
jgi:3-phenylpropionate/trans-cinnamate dioxygenase ferredoxin component